LGKQDRSKQTGGHSGVNRFFLVHGPFAQTNEMIEKSVDHRANQ